MTEENPNADAASNLDPLPNVDIGATRPRGPDEIQFEPGDEERKPVPSKPGDPLDGIPSVPPNVTGGVPESDVTGS
jgi:hypothetical protein